MYSMLNVTAATKSDADRTGIRIVAIPPMIFSTEGGRSLLNFFQQGKLIEQVFAIITLLPFAHHRRVCSLS